MSSLPVERPNMTSVSSQTVTYPAPITPPPAHTRGPLNISLNPVIEQNQPADVSRTTSSGSNNESPTPTVFGSNDSHHRNTEKSALEGGHPGYLHVPIDQFNKIERTESGGYMAQHHTGTGIKVPPTAATKQNPLHKEQSRRSDMSNELPGVGAFGGVAPEGRDAEEGLPAPHSYEEEEAREAEREKHAPDPWAVILEPGSKENPKVSQAVFHLVQLADACRTGAKVTDGILLVLPGSSSSTPPLPPPVKSVFLPKWKSTSLSARKSVF